MANEIFSLTWHSYANHFKDVLGNLLSTGDSSDVTLICDDQVKFKAHKFILNACSPVFKYILEQMNEPQAIVYLRGIHHMELKPILEFIYNGQATLYQERTAEFLKVAKELDIKEIKDVPVEEECDDKSYEDVVNEYSDEIVDQNDPKEDIEPILTERQESPKSRKFSNIWQTKSEVLKCPKCDKVFKSQSHMTDHIMYKHEGKGYPCDQCNVQASTKSKLTRHIKSSHSGITYPCNYCEFKTNRADSLKSHLVKLHRIEG